MIADPDDQARVCEFCGIGADECSVSQCDFCLSAFCIECEPHRTDDAPVDVCPRCAFVNDVPNPEHAESDS